MITNALSPMRAIETLGKLINPNGTIAIMSSGQGSVANNDRGGFEIYRASKSALNQLMRSYAARHAGELRALVRKFRSGVSDNPSDHDLHTIAVSAIIHRDLLAKQVQKALDGEPYVLLGPGYSGSVKVTAPLAAEAGITQIMGGEAAELTQAGNKFLFRTSFGQQSSMPKVAKYINDELKAKSVAIVWVNNDFGKGGRDAITREFSRLGIKVAVDISTEAGQVDFAADVSKVKAAAPDAVFIYLNEEESARILKELKRQSVTTPLVGETTLIGQKVVELAGDAANGARGHVGLTTDAPVELIKSFREKFVKKYNYVPDHNGIKGYLAVYMIKAATEKMGKVDPKAFADALHGLTIKVANEPGILMDVTFDQNGDVDRQGFLVEIVDGKQVIKQVLPKLN